MRRLKRKKKSDRKKTNYLILGGFADIKTAVVKISAFAVIAGLNWAGFSVVIQTNSYFSDTENSKESTYMAGILDFALISPFDFSPATLDPGGSATRAVHFINAANIPQYNITAASLVGAACDYLNLEASLDGNILYSGNLTAFAYGPLVFEDPDRWLFALTLPANALENVQGQSCQFKFVFFGSQIKNGLPFGQGFTDEEDINNNISIADKICYNKEVRSKGFWKNHHVVYLPHLPQYLGAPNEDEIIDTYEKANQVFLDYDLSMRDKLKGQLLAMKFNIAHFGIGEYLVEFEGKTLNQIAAEADDLLRQDPEPSQEVLEEMKGLLDNFNNSHQIRVCSLTPPHEIEDEEELLPAAENSGIETQEIEEQIDEQIEHHPSVQEPVAEEPVIEQIPVVEDQPVIAPENNSQESEIPTDNRVADE